MTNYDKWFNSKTPHQQAEIKKARAEADRLAMELRQQEAVVDGYDKRGLEDKLVQQIKDKVDPKLIENTLDIMGDLSRLFLVRRFGLKGDGNNKSAFTWTIDLDDDSTIWLAFEDPGDRVASISKFLHKLVNLDYFSNIYLNELQESMRDVGAFYLGIIDTEFPEPIQNDRIKRSVVNYVENEIMNKAKIVEYGEEMPLQTYLKSIPTTADLETIRSIIIGYVFFSLVTYHISRQEYRHLTEPEDETSYPLWKRSLTLTDSVYTLKDLYLIRVLTKVKALQSELSE